MSVELHRSGDTYIKYFKSFPKPVILAWYTPRYAVVMEFTSGEFHRFIRGLVWKGACHAPAGRAELILYRMPKRFRIFRSYDLLLDIQLDTDQFIRDLIGVYRG